MNNKQEEVAFIHALELLNKGISIIRLTGT
jgi:hypothetical protein